MSAHAAPASGGLTLSIRGATYPVAAAEAQRSAPAPRGDDHLAAGDRAGRLPLPALDRADPHLARDVRRARGRDRLPQAARPALAGECAPDRQRRRVRAARARDRARRLVEHCAAGGSSPARRRSRSSRSTCSSGAARTSSTRRTSGSSSASSRSAAPAPRRSTSGGARCRAGSCSRSS